MRYCPYCGDELLADKPFCASCGKKIPKELFDEEEEACEKEVEKEECSSSESESQNDNSENNFSENQEEKNEGESVDMSAAFRHIVEENARKRKGKALGFSIAALACAVYSVIPLFGIFMFMPGFVVFTAIGKSNIRAYLDMGYPRKGAVKAACALSTAAIPVGIVFSLISAIYILMLV